MSVQIGNKYGRLVVTGLLPCRKATVLCDCGENRTVNIDNMLRGKTKSCGCLRREMVREKSTIHGGSARKQPEYYVWKSMRSRCLRKNDKNYDDYGGRGIMVDVRWHSFANFIRDMGKRPSPELELERINNDGNYEPKNCKWATHSEQMKNTRRTACNRSQS